MRKRRVFVAFPKEQGFNPALFNNSKVLEGLNIHFNIKTVSSFGIPEQATIDIYNLNREDLKRLMTSAETWMKKQSLIQLYAGYDDDVNCLFSGKILESPVEGYPDLAIHIKGQSGLEYMSDVIDIQKSNLKIVDLIDYASSVVGQPVNLPNWLRNSNEMLNKRLEDFSYTGTVWNLLDKIQGMCGGFDLDGRAFTLSTYNDQTYVWSPTETKEGSTLLISEETGMVGVPNLSSYGINVKMLLNTKVVSGDVVKVVSKRVPIVNGLYYVNEIVHDGELRGKNWYTTLHCNRIGKEMEVMNGRVEI